MPVKPLIGFLPIQKAARFAPGAQSSRREIVICKHAPGATEPNQPGFLHSFAPAGAMALV